MQFMWESFDCNISNYYYDTLNEFPRVHFNLVKLKRTNFLQRRKQHCMISLYYVYEEGGSPEGGWVMWIYYYTYFVTEETCSIVAHIHTPQPRRFASADTRTEPDNDILVSSYFKRKHSLWREISFQHRDRRIEREKLVVVLLIIWLA